MTQATTDDKLRSRAFANAEKTLANFRIDHHGGPSTRCKIYRCWDGKSSTYLFDVAEYGANLVVTGDMGEWVWQRTEHMLRWARESWKSDSYFAEKLQAYRPDSFTEWWPEAARQWLREERAERGGEKIEAAAELEELEAELSYGDGEHAFKTAAFNTEHFCDAHDWPAMRRYAYRFHWVQRAIGWLAEKTA